MNSIRLFGDLRARSSRRTPVLGTSAVMAAAFVAACSGGDGNPGSQDDVGGPDAGAPAAEPAEKPAGADPFAEHAAVERPSEEQLRALMDEIHASPAGTSSGTREHPVAELPFSAVRTESLVPTHSFCFQQNTVYNDAGIGEDAWTEDGVDVARAMSFAFFTYGAPDGTSGYGLLDVFGCATFTNAPTGNWSFAIFSIGAVGASTVAVYGKEPGLFTYQDGFGTWALQGVNLQASLAANTANPQVVPPFKAWLTQPSFNGYTTKPGPLNGYPALVAALFQHNAGQWTYRFTMDTDHSTTIGGGATNCSLSGLSSTTHGPAWRYPDHTFLDNKFQPTHELGHAVFCAGTGFDSGTVDDTTFAGTCGNGNGHTETSIEYQGAAFAEGFANFYSALSWNTDSVGADCSTGSDCDGSATYALPYAKSVCSTLSSPAGCTPGTAGCNVLGNEWDWTRELWAVKTASPQPSLNDMFNWIHLAMPGMNKGNTYVKMDTAANGTGVTSAIKTAWNATKNTQGVSAH